MMQYFTEINIPEFPEKIDHSSKIIMMGSCFTENVGLKLEQLKFNIEINPFGILYNPISVANSIKILLNQRLFNGDDLFFRDGLWHSFAHHGKFSGNEKETVLENINARIKKSSRLLREADFLFLTFGTAWVYELKATGQVVANCHKVPAGEFRRFRLPVNNITEVYQSLLEELWLANPKLKIIFTVSPVRHWKDGAPGNQVSKATLIVAIDNIVGSFDNFPCWYFPSYEIVMDELRDYRFFADDMLHLSDVAVVHIYKKFESGLITEDSRKISDEIINIQKAINHRPFNKNTPEFKKFITKGLKKVNSLMKKHPYLNLLSEKEYFEKQLGGIKT